MCGSHCHIHGQGGHAAAAAEQQKLGHSTEPGGCGEYDLGFLSNSLKTTQIGKVIMTSSHETAIKYQWTTPNWTNLRVRGTLDLHNFSGEFPNVNQFWFVRHFS